MTRISFLQRIAQKDKPLLADGAMGTHLHAHGLPMDTCFDQLNITQPAIILDTHRAYLASGAEMIETNTFGANRFKLAEHDLDDQVVAINRAGAMLARQAVAESG